MIFRDGNCTWIVDGVAVVPPLVEVPLDGFSWAEVLGQITALAALVEDIKDRIDDIVEVGFACGSRNCGKRSNGGEA